MPDDPTENDPRKESPDISHEYAGESDAPVEITQQVTFVEQDELITEEQPSPEMRHSAAVRFVGTILVAVSGWFVPGLGHLLQRRVGRAVIGFACVGVMTLFGLWMRGNVFPPHADDVFGVLGFIADVSAGIFYFAAHTLEKAGPDVSRAAGDYGTRLVATAGVINLLFVLDAIEILRGHKN
jgi:hypothetical protein